ncbi:cytochrome P450-dit2 [Rhizopus stolonifer]|uniref:Cytochrome P450-dit2 n=1 Tax=Rhizopus stolonifer TaxID=4846 RepID=A0A367KRW0_RHIST|nr:cytochrome P450-dit2 [Rhizopus stolonifer]
MQELTVVQRRRYLALLVSLASCSYIVKTFWRAFVVPKALRHLPKVNTLSWFWSVIKGESHDVRVKKLMMPHMNEHGLCLKYILGRWTLTVGDPILLQKLLKDIDTYPKEQISMDPDLILTNQEPNMGNANHKDWRRQRGVANPVFHRAMPLDTFGQIASRMFKSMETQYPDGKVDVADYMRRYALDCLGLGIFNFDMEALYVLILFVGIVRDPLVYLFPAYARIPSRYIPYRNRARKANENLRKLLSNIIQDRKSKIQDHVSEEKDYKPDLLTLMIMAAKEHRSVDSSFFLTDGELVSNLAVFFVAGHETTASATASFLYYLAAHPEIQEKARAEVLNVLGDLPEEIAPNDGELRQMNYLNNCIRETMRINPPTSGNLPRIVTKDTDLGGFFIPKETRVAIELYTVHHLNRYWYKPEEFNPDRFDKESSSYREEAVWMPFGYGPRQCIGLNFSLSEQRVLMAMMLKRYTWKLVKDSEHQLGLKNAGGGGIGLLGPESLQIQLEKRYV